MEKKNENLEKKTEDQAKKEAEKKKFDMARDYDKHSRAHGKYPKQR